MRPTSAANPTPCPCAAASRGAELAAVARWPRGQRRRWRCRWSRRRRSSSSAGGTPRAGSCAAGGSSAAHRGPGTAWRDSRAGDLTTPGLERHLRLALASEATLLVPAVLPLLRWLAAGAGRRVRSRGPRAAGLGGDRRLARRARRERQAPRLRAGPSRGAGPGAVGAPVRGPHRRRLLGRGRGPSPPAGGGGPSGHARPARRGRRRRARRGRRGARAGARGGLGARRGGAHDACPCRTPRRSNSPRGRSRSGLSRLVRT